MNIQELFPDIVTEGYTLGRLEQLISDLQSFDYCQAETVPAAG